MLSTPRGSLSRLPEDDAEIDYEASVTRHSPQSLKSTNPLLTSSVVEQEVAELFSFHLFHFDGQFNTFAVNEHVVSWETSADGFYELLVEKLASFGE